MEEHLEYEEATPEVQQDPIWERVFNGMEYLPAICRKSWIMIFAVVFRAGKVSKM